MQANFGTPQENRLIGPLDELQRLEASGRGSSPEAEALRGEIRQKAAGPNPGGGPTVEGWEVIDLDGDGNGIVDARDLARARQRGGSPRPPYGRKLPNTADIGAIRPQCAVGVGKLV